MRRAFAHDVVVAMADDGDIRAPGAAITVALCGHWEHRPPCPLAPHRTDAERSGGDVRLRVLFASEPAAETEVRDRIERALREAALTLPDGATARWRLLTAEPGAVRADETETAESLVNA
jgi:hypothetical protein